MVEATTEDAAKKEQLIKALISKIQETAFDVYNTGTGTLTLNKDELQDLLQTLVFADPDILQTAQNFGLVVPSVKAMLNFIIKGGTPKVEFLQRDGTNQVRFIATNTTFNLALGDAQPKDFAVDIFGIRMTNYVESEKRINGQVALAGLTLEKDIPVTNIPGVGLLGAVAPATTAKGLLNWALEENLLMTTLYNRVVPIIAANGPIGKITSVKGLKTDIGNDSLTMTFLRDEFTPYPSKSVAFGLVEVIKQMPGFSYTRK